MPNVLIYMSDEHNPFVSSVYGHPRVRTPHLDRLAAAGTVYQNAYCPSPLCAPSRSAFLAGRPAHQVRVYNNCNVIRHPWPSYGAVLAAQGVHTVHAGKVDAYDAAGRLGFSEMLAVHDRHQPGDLNFRRAPLAIRQGAHQRADGFGPRPERLAGDVRVVDEAVAWLTERAPGLGRPWTLTVNTGAPHFPHWVTPELWELYRDDGDLPPYGVGSGPGHHPYARDLQAHFETERFTPEQIRGLRRGYLGRVTFVDQQLGRLMDAVQRAGLAGETVVAYASDHGEMLGKFGMWWKCSLYEDSVRVPLVVAGPGFGAGRRVRAPVSLLDLQAAMFSAVGAERPSEWWGRPLQEVPTDDPERVVFAEYHGHGVRSGAFMVRRGGYKLLYNMAAPHQLFDLERDPDELENLAEREPGVVAGLEGELRRLCDPEAEDRRAWEHEREQVEAVRGWGGGAAAAPR